MKKLSIFSTNSQSYIFIHSQHFFLLVQGEQLNRNIFNENYFTKLVLQNKKII